MATLFSEGWKVADTNFEILEICRQIVFKESCQGILELKLRLGLSLS